MQPHRALRVRTSFLARHARLARLGATAVVATLLAGIPSRHAQAADEQPASLANADAPITALADRLDATRRETEQRLHALVHEALRRAAQRVHDTRRGMARMLDLGHALVTTEAPATKRPPRLDYVTNTNDPLAGL